MAKNPKNKNTMNLALLGAIAKATADGGYLYVSPAEGGEFVSVNPPLIEVNKTMLDPNDASKAAARITDAGVKYLAANSGAAPVAAAASPFAVITNAVLPASKRGNKGGGAPTLYPFATLEIGQTFFVPVSEKHKDPVKQLGSTVSSQNAHYSEPTGEKQTVMRTKRGPGNKAVKGPDGNNVKEEVTIDVKKATRKFTIRAVKGGEVYGGWTAPADGASIGRIAI